MFFDPQCQPTSEPVTTNPDAALLRKAASLIRERGHGKKVYLGVKGEVCLLGALLLLLAKTGAACGGAGHRVIATRLAGLVMSPRDVVDPYSACAQWNDAPGTTGDMVVKRLEDAASRLEQQST